MSVFPSMMFHSLLVVDAVILVYFPKDNYMYYVRKTFLKFWVIVSNYICFVNIGICLLYLQFLTLSTQNSTKTRTSNLVIFHNLKNTLYILTSPSPRDDKAFYFEGGKMKSSKGFREIIKWFLFIFITPIFDVSDI